MKKWVILTASIFLLLGTCAWMVGPYGTYRYKLTLEVETPEGLKSGYAVREVKTIHGIKLTPESHPSVRIRGEAVVVDLGERGVAFSIIEEDAKTIACNAFPVPGESPGSGCTTPEGIRYYDSLKEGKAILPLKWLPTIVTFTDLKDPTSVQYVYGVERYEEPLPHGGSETGWRVKEDNFEKLFGQGVKLKQVTIEMTDEPVTIRVLNWLPWLLEYKNKLFDKRTVHTINAKNQLANSLGMGSFSANTINKENKK